MAEVAMADAFLDGLDVPNQTTDNAQTEPSRRSLSPLQSLQTYLNANTPPGGSAGSMPAPNDAPAAPAGAPPGTSRSAVAVSRLNELAQLKGYQLDFDIAEVSAAPVLFGGRLAIRGSDEVVTLPGSYPSKKGVKAALAEAALGVVERLPGRQTMAGSTAVDGHGSNAADGGPGDESKINWVGRLLEYERSRPDDEGEVKFTEYCPPGNTFRPFAATVSVPGYPAPFGSATETHATKKLARTMAARDAVRRLEADGHCSPDGMPIKKPKRSTLNANNQTAAPVPGSAPFSTHGALGTPTEAVDEAVQSVPEQVAGLCRALGLQPVAYRLAPCTVGGGGGGGPGGPPGSIYDCEAHLSTGGGQLLSCYLGDPTSPLGRVVAAGQPLGRAEKVFGKQRAKAACAALVLALLRDEAAFRTQALEQPAQPEE